MFRFYRKMKQIFAVPLYITLTFIKLVSFTHGLNISEYLFHLTKHCLMPYVASSGANNLFDFLYVVDFDDVL